MKVKNINGTSDNTCKCGSWLDHWKKFSGQSLPTYCPETKCIQKPEVGAHVQKDSSTDSSWYIVPFCKTHNGGNGQVSRHQRQRKTRIGQCQPDLWQVIDTLEFRGHHT